MRLDQGDCWHEEGAEGTGPCVCVYIQYEWGNERNWWKLEEKEAGRETGQIYGVPFQFLKPAHITLTRVIRGGVGEALL